MKTLFLILITFLSSNVFAHEDHLLGEGSLHAFYHVTFWTIFALVLYKGVTWYKKNKSSAKK